MKLTDSILMINAIINSCNIFITAEFTAVVNTTSGPMRGIIEETVNSVKYAAFKGIKYAVPPVGYLRFQPPVPRPAWKEIYNATDPGPLCPQIGADTGYYVGSEDCLVLHVFTPVTDLETPPKTLKTVMVWIYGGGFRIGTSSPDIYHPDYMLERDVVFVSMNYRLGLLGFLNLNHPNATGNAGLKDQVLVLKWVRANIQNFGGNPNNVTIYGQSAGAHSVGYHVLSEASAGLFHGAISMSGVPLNLRGFRSFAKVFAKAVTTAGILGINSTDTLTLLSAFYNATAQEIVEATAVLPGHIFEEVFPPFALSPENASIATDVFLSECPLIKYYSSNFSKVPQILGFTEQETSYYSELIDFMAEFIAYNPNSAKEFDLELPESLIKEVRNLLANSSGVLVGTTLQKIINITSDIFFVAQTDQVQRLLAANNGEKPVYYYQNSFKNPRPLHSMTKNNSLPGVGHADDLAYIFYFSWANYSTDPTDPICRTKDRISTMWTNFAKYGNPTPSWINDTFLNVTWPNSGLSGTLLNIGDDLEVSHRRINHETKLLEMSTWALLGKSNGCVP